MKKNYVKPAIKAADIVTSQIVMTSGSSDPEPGSDPKDDQFLPFNPSREDEGYGD